MYEIENLFLLLVYFSYILNKLSLFMFIYDKKDQLSVP